MHPAGTGTWGLCGMRVSGYHRGDMMMDHLPPMLCPACGLIETPRLRPGAGPHVARALCTECNNFLRWLPKALRQPKETPRMGGVNRVTLVGGIGEYGVEVRYATRGAPCATSC